MTSGKKIRVLRVIPTLATGGTEKQCIEILTEFAENSGDFRCEISLATLYGPPETHILEAPDAIRRFDFNERCSLMGLRRASLELKCVAADFDCIHAMLWPSVWAAAAAIVNNVPLVASLHGSGMAFGPLGLKRAVDRKMFGRACLTVFNTTEGRDLLAPALGIPTEKTSVIANGKRLLPAAGAEKKTLVCAARVQPPKRHDLLLDALALLPPELTVPAVFIGRGTDTKWFASEISSRGLETAKCTGELPDITAYLETAKILALPSDHEGMSNAIMEAWMAGAAVIASRVSGVTGLTRDGEDALLVENTPRAWADGLKRLIEDGDLRERLALAGRKRAETGFSIKTAAKAWDETYVRAAESSFV